MRRLLLAVLPLFIIPALTFAQETTAPAADTLTAAQTRNFMKEYLSYYDSIQNFRYYDQRGVNVFETPKDKVTFQGLRVRFGAGFTQQFQSLKHENYLSGVTTVPPAEVANKLYPLSTGFNTAQANLNMDVQLADGIRLHLVTYLSARHHNEAWVKGGYIQFDKLPFKGQFWDKLMDIVTVKVGHMEINYGDAHFRRSDGGQTLYNPFMENYIIDAFTTEIGGEVYARLGSLFGMVGLTNGEIKGDVKEITAPSTDPVAKKSPAIYLKGGFDHSFSPKLRVRGTASYYGDKSSANNTLFWGDRTGSNYFLVMENAAATATAQAWSGRVNPLFSDRTQGFMLNGFLKFSGLELFGTYETGKGRQAAQVGTGTGSPEDRNFNQFAADVVYRIGPKENLFVGARYNTVSLDNIWNTGVKGNADPMKNQIISEVGIDRTAFAAGWFLTKNVLLKGEYVIQNYKDYDNSSVPKNQYAKGKFSGYVIEAIVGF
ncbi:MAG TPA: hypothetical protein VFX73_13285 [Chitinophagaceae bacterium]|nr:hypothetical protein [Chitinophagaceae bacterium]